MEKPLEPFLFVERDEDVLDLSCKVVFLRKQTGATAGNLSVQIDKLQRAGYIEVEKSFRGKMPCTVCRMTDTGREAFAEYVDALKSYIG